MAFRHEKKYSLTLSGIDLELLNWINDKAKATFIKPIQFIRQVLMEKFSQEKSNQKTASD